MLTKDDPYVGMDLDNSYDVDLGEHKPWAATLLAYLRCAYLEVSPSRKGIHAIVLGNLPKDAQHKLAYEDGGVELYDYHFLTFTGDVLPASVAADEPLLDQTYELQDLYDFVFPTMHYDDVPEQDDASTESSSPIDDHGILYKAITDPRHGEHFWRCYFYGDTRPWGDDDSRADLALCGELAYWCGQTRSALTTYSVTRRSTARATVAPSGIRSTFRLARRLAHTPSRSR